MPIPVLTQTTWRKSSRSQNGSANCVELVRAAESMAVRDSKNPGGATLLFSSASFDTFLRTVRDTARA